jgi:hypothetical protein
MFHLTVEVKFPMDKAHVTDMTATTETCSRALTHPTLRELKITYKKKNP